MVILPRQSQEIPFCISETFQHDGPNLNILAYAMVVDSYMVRVPGTSYLSERRGLRAEFAICGQMGFNAANFCGSRFFSGHPIKFAGLLLILTFQ
jgi:hypothetical protein